MASKYRLARAIIIKHLQQTGAAAGSDESSISARFEHIQSNEFQDYLKENAVRFFLTSQSNDNHSTANSIRYLKVIRYLALKGYSVAFLDGLEFASSKVRH